MIVRRPMISVQNCLTSRVSSSPKTTCLKKLSNELNQMKLENKNVAEELVDIKTKSMRDNLIFFDFDEESTFDSRKSEDCCAKIKCFVKKISVFLTQAPVLKLIKRIALENLHPVLKGLLSRN